MPSSSRNQLFEVAERQQGFFTAQQAVNCGYDRRNFPHFVKEGSWVRAGRGIYQLCRFPVTGRPELVIWSLWSRGKDGVPQGVWSHYTALEIHDLTDAMPQKMHMTAPKTFRKTAEIPNLIVIHRGELSESDIETRNGFQVTTPLRTLLDLLSEGMLIEQVAAAFLEAISKGLLSVRMIRSSPIWQTEEGRQVMELIENERA